MAAHDSNRQPTSVLGVLSNSTNYIGLSKIDRKLFESQLFPLKKVVEGVSSRLSPAISLVRKKPTGRNWDLRVTGATVLLECLSQELTKSANSQIRTGHYIDVKRSNTEETSPGAALRIGHSVFRPFRKEMSAWPCDSRTHFYQKIHRSVSGDLRNVERSKTDRVKSHPEVASKAARLFARTEVASVRSVSTRSIRVKRTSRSPGIPRSEKRDRRPRDLVPISVKKIPLSHLDESPTKKLYKRLLQATSEQIERENFQGWT